MADVTLTAEEKAAARREAKAKKERERRARIKAQEEGTQATSGAQEAPEAVPSESALAASNGERPRLRAGGGPAEILAVLAESDGPLHVKEITERVLARGNAKLGGKTPQATVAAMLSVDSRKPEGYFRKVERGVFALR